MGQVNVNIRMDAELKKQFDAFCKEVGLTMSAAVNVFARKAVKEKRIPFSIGEDAPGAETLAALEEIREMKLHPEKYKAYSDVDEMFREILG